MVAHNTRPERRPAPRSAFGSGRRMVDRYAPTPNAAPSAAVPADTGRYLIVPCETETGLAVIWDRHEEQVVDVIDAAARRYSEEDALWDEGRRGYYEPLRWAA